MSGLISWPRGGQGSSEEIGSDADDETPRSQILGGGIPCAVNQGDRLTTPGSEKPAIHQFKADLSSSRFQRLEPARHAASPRMEPTGLRGTREQTVEQAPIMSSGNGYAGFHDQASTGRTKGRPYSVELPFHPSYLPIRGTWPAVSRLFAFLFAREWRNGKISLIRSLEE